MSFSRDGDINIIMHQGPWYHQVRYYPHQFACPITYFCFMQSYDDDEIQLFIQLASFPNLEGLIRKLELKEEFEAPSQAQEQEHGARLRLMNVNQEDINWFVQLMKEINLEFNRHFFDNDIITEVQELFRWLQATLPLFVWLENPAPFKPPYAHIVPAVTCPVTSYINPALASSTALSYVVEDFLNKINDVDVGYLEQMNKKLIACLSSGEDPNQTGRYQDGNILDRLMRYSVKHNLDSYTIKSIEFFLIALTKKAVCYGLDAFTRNNVYRISTFEWSATLSFWPVYSVLVQSVSTPRPPLQIKQNDRNYIENDRINTLLIFPGKKAEDPDQHIIISTMPTEYLTQNDIIGAFNVYTNLFEGVNDNEEKKQLLGVFCDYLRTKKFIQVFYHDGKVIGYNLSFFDIDHVNKKIIFHGDYFLILRLYQHLGIVPYTYPLLALMLKIYLGNTPEYKDYALFFDCELVSAGGHKLVELLLYFPKYQTHAMAKEKELYAKKLFPSCTLFNQGITWYVEDEVIAKTPTNVRSTLLTEFFNEHLRGLSPAMMKRLFESNRATLMRTPVAYKYFNHWTTIARNMGIQDPEGGLLELIALLTQTTWGRKLLKYFPSKKTDNVYSFLNALHIDESQFFLEQNVPAPLNGRPVMPRRSRY